MGEGGGGRAREGWRVKAAKCGAQGAKPKLALKQMTTKKKRPLVFPPCLAVPPPHRDMKSFS